MRNVSVKVKMISIAFITVMGMMIIGIFTLSRIAQMQKSAEEALHESIEEDYDENIKNQVENAISLLDAVYAGYEAGDYTLDEAKKFLRDSFNEEVRIDKEENGWDTNAYIDDEGMIAAIFNRFNDRTDVTYMKIGNIYQ